MATLKAPPGGGSDDSGEPAAAGPSVPAYVAPPPQPLGRQLSSDGAAEWYDVLPEMAGRGDGQDPYPKVVPSPPFWLVYAPDRWDVLEGVLIPQLYRLSMNPGVNGVVRGQGGRPDPTDAIASVERQGHYRLDWRIDGTSYLRAYQVGLATDRKTGAPIKVMSWHTRFEQLYAGSEVISADSKAYAAWVGSLVEGGLLPRARPYVVERLIRLYETRLHKALGKHGAGSEIVELYRSRLGVCLAEQQRQRIPTGPPVAPLDVDPDLEVSDPPIDDLEPRPPARKRTSP